MPEREEAGAALVDRARRTRSRPSRTSDSTSGVEREPGDVHASRMPQRASSSHERAQQQVGVGAAGMMIGAMPGTSSSSTASRRPAARWDAVVERLAANAIARSRPTSAATARRPARGRSTFAACVADVLAARPSASTLVRLLDGRPARAARRARGAASASSGSCWSATTAGHRGPGRARARAARPTTRSPTRSSAGRSRTFAARWAAQPLFADDAARGRSAVARATCLRNDPAGLAAALRGLGTGRDGAAVGPARRAGASTVAVVGGERDAKFRALGERLAGASCPRRAAAWSSAAPATRCRARGSRSGSPRSCSPSAAVVSRRRQRRATPSPGAAPATPRSTPARAAATAPAVDGPSKSAERRQAAGQLDPQRRRACSAAAIPSGPSNVEAR